MRPARRTRARRGAGAEATVIASNRGYGVSPAATLNRWLGLRASLAYPRRRVFTSLAPSVLLDYLRVPVRYLDLDSRSSLGRVAHASGRALCWPASAAPGPAPEHRLGTTRLFAPVLADEAVRPRLPAGEWSPAEEVTDAAGGVAGHLWRERGGSVALPFSPDAALVNLWSEAYQAGARSAGAKRLALLAYYRVRPFLPRRVQIAPRRQLARGQARAAFPRRPAETAVPQLYDLVLGLLRAVAGEPGPGPAPAAP